MTAAAATALLALAEANKALVRACTAFQTLGDDESAELMRETIEDNAELMQALVMKRPVSAEALS